MKTIKKTVHDAIIELNGEWNDNASVAIQIKGTQGICFINCETTMHAGQYVHVCNRQQFNAHVDMLATNFGEFKQSYEDYVFECNHGMSNTRLYEMQMAMNEAPVYTQEIADSGVLPSVGMECQTSTGILTIKYVGQKVIVSEDSEGAEFMTSVKSALHSFKPLTPPVTLIDGEAYKFDFDNGSNIIQHKKMAMYDERRRCMWIKGHAYPIESCANIKPLTVEDKQ